MSENTYKASNGITIKISDEGYLIGTRGSEEAVTHATGGAEYGVQALREFFQYERDQELGRVRWPENPDYVIYRIPGFDLEDGRCVRVTDERTGRSWRVWENVLNYGSPTPNHMAAAHWYFTEGPGKVPVLAEAQPGEVWRLTFNGEECAALYTGEWFIKSKDGYKEHAIRPTHKGITAGRKLLNADGSLADE